jgi:hypothetical protein
VSLGPAEILVWLVVLVFVSVWGLLAAVRHLAWAGWGGRRVPVDPVVVPVTPTIAEGSA